MHSRAIIFEHYCKLAAIWSVVVVVVSSMIYVTFLLLAVKHTDIRAQAEASIKETASELGDVQAQYLVVTQSITQERAAALGFVQPKASDVTYADAATQAFSIDATHANTK